MGFFKPDTLIFKEAAQSGKIKTISKLLKKKDFRENGAWALEYAIDKNHIETVKELMNNGILKTTWGYTALSYAIKINRHEIIDMILSGDINPDIDKENHFDSTALFYASAGNNADLVKKLIKIGAAVNVLNENGDTALSIAIDNNNLEIAEILLKNGADVNNEGRTVPLIRAVRKKYTGAIELLLKYKANINTVNYEGETALHTVSKRNNTVALNIFLNNKQTDINIKDKNSNTPLYMAAKAGNINIVVSLLKAGALVDEVNNNGQTPLMLASKGDDITIAWELIKYNANINATCNEGKTAETYAVEAKNKDIIALIKIEKENILKNKAMSEIWDIIDSEKISHITTNYKQQRKLTEIFNFRSLTHFVISENLKLKTESVSSIIPFSSLNEDSIKIAFNNYKKQGGEIKSGDVFKNKLDKPSILPLGQS